MVMRFTSVVPVFLVVSVIFIIYSCQKEYSLGTSAIVSTASATGTLFDSLGNCMVNSVVGTYYNGITPGSDTAFVKVNVNVKTVGRYAITSNTQNGLYFADSGYFYHVGINTVRLKPVGAAYTQGSSFYTFGFDSSACFFNVHVNDSTGTGLGHGTGTAGIGAGTWQYSRKAGDTTRGRNTTATFVSSGSINALSIAGSNPTGDSVLSIIISLPSSTIPSTGTFSASSGDAILQVRDAFGASIYSAGAIAGVTLTVNITSYNAATKELTGTFSGNVKGVGGVAATLSAGKFDVVVK